MIVVKVKKLHPDAKLPTKGTKGSACYDLYACENAFVQGVGTTAVRTGLAFEVPDGYEMEIRPRSGLARDRSISVRNTPGTLDSDYRGELLILLWCTGSWSDRQVQKGDRIAQFKINEVLPVKLVETSSLSETKRGSGGYGSTGR